MKYVETKKIELKVKRNADIIKEIIAFLNTLGGTIYVGIDDNGIVVGVNADEETLSINNVIRDSILPNASPFVNVTCEIIEGKEVVVVNVVKGSEVPYYAKRQGFGENGIYIRVGTSKRKATPDEIRSLTLESNGVTFEQSLATVQELSFESLKSIFRHEKNVEVNIQNQLKYLLDIKTNKFNNAAYLVSDQNSGPRNIIRLMRFKGNVPSADKVIENRDFDNSIVKQYVDLFEYLNLNNMNYNRYINSRRTETRDYPQDAIREAIVNAIIHRNYIETGTIRISLLEDRIEIVSPGELIVSKTGFIGVSKPRNELCARIFQTLGYMENFGTGFQKIINAYKKYNIDPIFDFGDTETKVTLLNVNYDDRLKEQKNKKGFFFFFFETPEYEELSLQEKNTIIELDNKDSIIRKDVEALLRIKESRANEILKGLENKGFIVKEGKGRSLKYVFPKDW